MGSTRRRPIMNLEYWRDYVDEIEATPVDALLGKASPAVRTALEHALAEKRTDARRRAAAVHRRTATTCARQSNAPTSRAPRTSATKSPTSSIAISTSPISVSWDASSAASSASAGRPTPTIIPTKRSCAKWPTQSRAERPRSACRAASTPTCRRSSIATCSMR